MPYLQLAPRQPWEPWGQACSLQAVHWLSGGLADYNPGSANPSDVWANGNAYHNTPARVVAKRATAPSFRSKGIARSNDTSCHPIGEWQLCRGLSWRFFHRRSPGRERTRMAGIDFSSYRLNVFLFPVHPIAQEKGPIASRFKKFFQFFSEAYHPKVDRLLCQAGFLSDFIPVVARHP